MMSPGPYNKPEGRVQEWDTGSNGDTVGMMYGKRSRSVADEEMSQEFAAVGDRGQDVGGGGDSGLKFTSGKDENGWIAI